MTAYSFQARFVPPILAGTKRQTVRAYRARHVQPGGELQLYTAMRTKHCKLIARSICETVQPVKLDVVGAAVFFPRSLETLRDPDDLNAFAVKDGFVDWSDLRAFWHKAHPGIVIFEGVLIQWHPRDA